MKYRSAISKRLSGKKKQAANERIESETISASVPHRGGAFFHWDGDVLVVNILGTPSAKRDKIGKPKGNQLKVSVTAKAVAGKATDHMVKFLAKEFGVKVNDIEVVFGRMNVNKKMRISHPGKFPRVFKIN